MKLSSVIGGLAAPSLSMAALIPRIAQLPLPHTVVAKFDNPTWLENIAIRPNGNLLVTELLPEPAVYTVAQPHSSSPYVSLVHTFSSVQGMGGITEIRPDVFAVLGGNLTAEGVPASGSFSAWTMDFSALRESPVISLAAALPDLNAPNGAVAVPLALNIILVADTLLGAVWRVDLNTGASTIISQVPEMAGTPGGVNGVKIYGGYLYWSNLGLATIYRLRITTLGYPVTGAQVETVAVLEAETLDDFAIGADGTIWACSNAGGLLFAVKQGTAGGNATSVVVLGAPTELLLAGDTAVAFGRGPSDGKILYVSTSGGLSDPVNGTLTEGGQVVAVDTSGWKSI